MSDDWKPESCWCGCKNPHFDDDLEETCGGSGMLNCYCGGDQCVCHWHGGIQCDGCEDCDETDGYDGGDE